MPVAFDPLEYALPSHFSAQVVQTAIAAARKAGDIQLKHFRSGKAGCRALLHDVKLDTDRRCEEAVLTAIRSRFPDHAVLTEESGRHAGPGGFTWIVDPLDGTVNFWHGLPFFCVSIACYGAVPGGGASAAGAVLYGNPVAGVVFLPFSRELFVGVPGRGAFLNDRPIKVRRIERPGDAVVTVSFGKTPATMQRMTRRLDALLPQVRKARCLGAAAAELAYIAAGFIGGFVYEGLKLWDFAAGKIILEEAGGFLDAAETEPDQWRVLAGAPGLQQLLAEIVK
jgi:fructose-1,6-bisphosphatase/inositol monophosphatase family enzyme